MTDEIKEMSVGESLYVFHKAFKWPRKKKYHTASVEAAELRLFRKSLINEEILELFEAINKEPAENILKELVDVVVVCVGMADTYGWDFDTAFARVHASNMSKLDSNGKPIHRKDGKVMKSENYKPPDLSDLV